LSEEDIITVSKFTGISVSKIYGVATFYTQFRFTPIGKKHIMVCKGTACHVKGASQIIEGIERHLGIKEGEITFDMEYSLESVGCLGCCALAPCAMLNEDVQSNLSLKNIKKIFSKKK
jgi:NADH-quinone oxidoreductase subunit E